MLAFEHQPVLLAEVLAALEPRPGGRYVDGTVGGGGHAAAILRASSPDGWLYGCDRDGAALKAAAAQLVEFSGRFELRHGTFAEVADWVAPGSCDGALLDLGVSSPQLREAHRGFSFQTNGPLDMRMDVRQELTGAAVIASAGEDELARMFWELGGERMARRVARAIVQERRQRPFVTTGQLAGLIERILPRHKSGVHPATRVFQALRIRVNDELGALARGLPAVWSLLKPGARLAVIAFHSGEDRLVKGFGRALERDYVVPGDVDVPELRQPRPAQSRWLSRKAVSPGQAELAANPRARSARLRVMLKV